MDAEAQDLFERCMRGNPRRLVKGGLVYQYVKSPFFVWCDVHAPEEERDPESAYMEMIFANGRRHEESICGSQYPEGVSIDPTQHDKAFQQTLDCLFAGEQYVKNGILYFLPDQMVAVPDVLVRTPGKSLWGDWHYTVVEIKSSKQIREEHIMQAAYYNYLIGFLQELTPATFTLVDGQRESAVFRYADYEPKVKDVVKGIRDIYAGFQPPPEKVGWPWESFSLKKLREQQSIALIPNLYSSHRDLLSAAGVRTLADFFSLNILHVQGIHFDMLEKYRRSAKALMQRSHIILEKPFLREAAVEVFLDFEGVEQVQVNGTEVSADYLIGALVREEGKETYLPFLAERPEQEHDMVISFLKFMSGKQQAVIYHFGSYEKSHLSRLMDRYGIHEEMAARVIDAMVDLLPIARRAVVFPTHSYSLKEIGKYLGMKWGGVADAKDSIVLYLDFLQNGNREALDKVVRYNRDDCTALRRLKDFLVWGT